MAKKSKASTILSSFVVIGLAFILLIGPLERGLFFREDYLPFFQKTAWFLIAIAVILVAQKETIFEPIPDLALIILVGLYGLSILWALDKGGAVDGALKYCTYLGIFLAAKYAAKDEKANRYLRWAIVASGIAAALVGLLAGAGLIEYEAAVVGGRIYGSFQYPNSLAAYEMFTFFVLFHSWLEAEELEQSWARWLARILFSVSGFMVLLVIVLSYSRATWIIFALAVVLYFVFLPKEIRGSILVRFLISFLPVLLVNSPISAALPESNYTVVRNYLLLGIAISLGLELIRATVSSYAKAKAPAEKAPGEDVSQSSRRHFVPSYIWAIVGLVLVAAVILGLTTELGQNLLSKVFPESIVQRFKSISLTDRNLLSRWFATLDAFAISKDYPFGGGAGAWDALYHRYQTTLYWFTEPHNHFAQVLVETGYPGLIAYSAFWILVLFMALKAWSLTRNAHKEVKERLRAKPESPKPAQEAAETEAKAKSSKGKKGKKRIPQIAYIEPVGNILDPSALKKISLLLSELIGIAFAVFVLVGHSAVDFDLSLPAIAIALFAGTGSLLGSCEAVLGNITIRNVLGLASEEDIYGEKRKTLWSRLFPKQAVDEEEGKASTKGKKQGRYAQPSGFSQSKHLVDGALIVCLALVIMIPANRYFQGMVYGSQGMYEMSQGNFAGGREYMAKAMQYDPYTSSYAIDIARTYIQQFFVTNDAQDAEKAKAYLEQAMEISPYSLDTKVTCFRLLHAMGYYDEAANIAYEVSHMIPLDIQYYESLADTAKTALVNHAAQIVSLNLSGEEKDLHIEAMKKYADWIKDIPNRLEERKARVTGLHEKMWDPNNLNPTPVIHLALGQVYFLEGNAELSAENLSLAAANADLLEETGNWLSALRTVSQVQVTLPEGIQIDDEAVQAIARLFGLMAK